jgi:hypothetical protein
MCDRAGVMRAGRIERLLNREELSHDMAAQSMGAPADA